MLGSLPSQNFFNQTTNPATADNKVTTIPTPIHTPVVEPMHEH